MKKISLLLIAVLTLISCSEKKDNLIVNGNIKGLKKGTVYLQKIDDTLLVNVDSLEINGDSQFVFETYIESPQIMYLYLEKKDNSKYNDRLDFFAEEGEINITTSLDKFDDAVIVGAKNQEKLMEYRKMMSKFNEANVNLIRENFEAQKLQNEEKLIELNTKYDQLLKRKYLYTVNFAINNKDLEIAPYLALSEVFDANIKYLDTIYTSLSKDVKDSKYGKDLEQFLKDRRKIQELDAKVDQDEQE